MNTTVPLLFDLAEQPASVPVNALESGASMENDTKDPYSDNSDTV